MNPLVPITHVTQPQGAPSPLSADDVGTDFEIVLAGTLADHPAESRPERDAQTADAATDLNLVAAQPWHVISEAINPVDPFAAAAVVQNAVGSDLPFGPLQVGSPFPDLDGVDPGLRDATKAAEFRYETRPPQLVTGFPMISDPGILTVDATGLVDAALSVEGGAVRTSLAANEVVTNPPDHAKQTQVMQRPSASPDITASAVTDSTWKGPAMPLLSDSGSEPPRSGPEVVRPSVPEMPALPGVRDGTGSPHMTTAESVLHTRLQDGGRSQPKTLAWLQTHVTGPNVQVVTREARENRSDTAAAVPNIDTSETGHRDISGKSSSVPVSAAVDPADSGISTPKTAAMTAEQNVTINLSAIMTDPSQSQSPLVGGVDQNSGTPGYDVRPDLQLPAASAKVTAQIADIARLRPDGPVDLVLHPEELGRLRFEMTQTGDAIRIHLLVERPETLELLRRNADQLLAEMRQNGFSDASMSFGQWGKDQPEKHVVPQVVTELDLRDGQSDGLAARFQPLLPPGRSGGLDLRL